MSVCCECCVCRQLEGSATGRSLVQRSPTECGVSQCDPKTSGMSTLRPLGNWSHEKRGWGGGEVKNNRENYITRNFVDFTLHLIKLVG